MIRNFIFICLLALSFVACRAPLQVAGTENRLIALDRNTSSKAAAEMENLIAPYRQAMEKEVNSPIGYVAETMELKQPESLLSNFFTDALLNYVQTTEHVAADLAILNTGGLRKPLNEGEITVRSIYEVMPFENQTVVVDLSGKDLYDLFAVFAMKGGEAVSSTVKFGICDGKAVNIRINDTPIDTAAIYKVVTSDYLLGGADGMTSLKNYRKLVTLDKMLRDVFIDYIKQKTAKGEKIQSHLDKRIYVVQE